MSVKVLTPGTGRKEPFKLLILGRPGTGKTRLAGSLPDPLFIDVEGGAGSAVPSGQPYTLRVPQNTDCLANVKGITRHINEQGDFDEETGIMSVTFGEHAIEFRTLVIDSLDAIQTAHKIFNVLGGRDKMRIQDWGTLLDDTLPLLYSITNLPIDVVVTAHTRQYENEDGEDIVGLAVQGGLKSQTPAFFDAILHLSVNKKNKRIALIQPRHIGGAKYMAKDRHNVFAPYAKDGCFVDITGEDDYPNNIIADAILGQGA